MSYPINATLLRCNQSSAILVTDNMNFTAKHTFSFLQRQNMNTF